MFEHSLIDLEAKPKLRRRWLSLPIAVGLHVVGLTAFAFASYWNVGTVQDPSLNIGPVTFLELPPPPGGGGPKPQPQEQKKQTAAPAPRELVQPKAEDVPDKPPAPATNETVKDLVPPGPPGPATSDPNSNGDCVVCPPGPGPVGPGPGGPNGPSVLPSGRVDNTPLKFSFGMTRPEIVHQVQPRYSEKARQTGTQGAVIVEAIIDEQGRVTNVRLIRGLPMGLDQAAMDAIQQWRFKPALLDGRPVKVYYTLTVNFTIQR
jgi:periplasmic protein TonB